jgi:hypothetical protein
MYDYEIRDVMRRGTHSRITLSFQIELKTREQEQLFPSSGTQTEYFDVGLLRVIARNEGRVYAQYLNVFVRIPAEMLPPEIVKQKNVIEGCCEFSMDNTIRDVVDVEVFPGGRIPKYGPSRFDPLLPGVSRTLTTYNILPSYLRLIPDEAQLEWSVYADNAPPRTGEVEVQQIAFVDERFPH